MSKPVILAVDDDASVLEAVVQDLRRKYGAEYRILRAGSGQAALDTCAQLKQRGDSVALVLSDQRMPGMSGVELLERVQHVYPEAKRALLTAYADTEAAIRAINTARISYYLTKPWDPPEEHLYPVLDDLLEAWSQGYKPPFEGLRVIGPRWSVRDFEVRDFLSRNQVPYVWLDPERDAEAVELLQRYGLEDKKLPALVFADGKTLVQPTQTELAERIGLRTHAEKDFYDLVVVGAGPAGLAAAVYGASEGLRTLVVEPEAPGGQAGSSSRIENYLGFPSGLSGADLARRAYAQASRFGAEFLTQRVCGIRADHHYRLACMADGREVSSHVCLIATGVHYRRLDVPGVERLTGLGVYYGAALVEARSCRDEEVFVVGGANSAGQAAMHFAKYARQVTMLVRGDSLEKSMSKYLINQIADTSNIRVETHSGVEEAFGEGRLESLRIRGPEGERTVPATALFIFIGAAPATDWLPEQVMRDPNGFILSGPDLQVEGKYPSIWKEKRSPYLLETSVPGVFVAGDVRHGSVKRAASAVGEGSIAVQFIHQYLSHF
ncbi:FAD-dependent oxidoreductase [Silvibacterium dinghuense]|uniref:Response regulator n=1 Tax=Silvibacterium dinghuense TaxID=1560006 RepID=A0A4V1NVR6_9BACT|nr:FAD-dependent oxidoreductase [Silvibacterium dinghuense]RXS96852.1 response regulator [Silvibacterium dinghuense]GGG94162.1 fused response regulator/thioredoxin-disulfide reductase [Silvibacterium dinghuense]